MSKTRGIGIMRLFVLRSAVLCIRNLIDAGVPEKVSMQIGARKNRRMLDRHHIVSTGGVTAAMKSVGAFKIQAGNPAKVLVGKKSSIKAAQQRRRHSSQAANTR